MDERLQRLRAAMAEDDGVQLNEPADEATVAAFEKQLGVTLPDEWRQWVMRVADGLSLDGEPGLYSLAEIAKNLDGDPKKPFAYSSAEAKAMNETIAKDGSAMGSERLMGMQKAGAPDGALPLAEGDGNDVPVMVVSGEQRGSVWHTGEIDVPWETGFAAWLVAYASNMFGVELD